jgi:aminoglycoside phosphotransferase family enzyme
MPADWHSSDEPRHDVIVAALRHPDAYSDGTPSVEIIETHRAWVFLTNAHAYKLAKATASHPHDAATLERRRRACQHELELNQRLGGDVYQGVVPLTRVMQGYRLDGDGPVVEWLIAMRRLPRALMLDVAIAEHRVHLRQVDALADVLLNFYEHAAPASMTGPEYRQRLLLDIDAKRAALARPQYGLDASSAEQLAATLHAWVARRQALLESRATTLVDAHGDLRPEHVCLEPRPVVIDCLEFDRELRRLDPASEIAFVALECRRLGAAWIGSRLLSRLALPPEANDLTRFYQGYHALVRAAVAIWHLDDPEQRRQELWRTRAEHYLRLGLERLDADTPGRADEHDCSHPPRAVADRIADPRPADAL